MSAMKGPFRPEVSVWKGFVEAIVVGVIAAGIQWGQMAETPSSWEEAQALLPALLLALAAGGARAAMNAWKNLDRPTSWLPGLLVVFALGVSGCATKAETRFVDADGTSFSAVSKAGPFGTLDTTNQQMSYKWDEAGGGLIAVGQDAQGLDNSGQVAAVTATGEALGAALGPILSQLVAGGVLGGGGAPGGDAAPSRVERVEQLLDLLERVAPLLERSELMLLRE